MNSVFLNRQQKQRAGTDNPSPLSASAFDCFPAHSHFLRSFPQFPILLVGGRECSGIGPDVIPQFP